MATTNKGLNLPSAGSTGWNVPLNANTDILDKAFGSFTTISSTSGVTDLTSDQVQNMCIKSTTSAFLAKVTYRIPSGVAGQWVIQNQSATSAYTLTVSNAAGGTSVTVGIGTVRSIYSDGTNVVYADTPSAGDFVNATISGTLTLGGGDLNGVATQAEAEAGTNTLKVMTPLRVSQAVAALATTPSNVGIGLGQTWQTVTRTSGTAYRNTTGKSIMVLANAISAFDLNNAYTAKLTPSVSSDGTTYVTLPYVVAANHTSSSVAVSFIVPNNHYYKLTLTGTGGYSFTCAELR